jgi:hypothetical protein
VPRAVIQALRALLKAPTSPKEEFRSLGVIVLLLAAERDRSTVLPIMAPFRTLPQPLAGTSPLLVYPLFSRPTIRQPLYRGNLTAKVAFAASRLWSKLPLQNSSSLRSLRMAAKTPKEWKEIRKVYEIGDILIKDLAAKWDVSTESIRKRSLRERWMSPRRIEQRGRAKVIKHNEENLEAEADKWSKAYLGAREDLLVAARYAIGQFRESVENDEIRVKEWKDVGHLLETLDKACGVTEKQPEMVQHPFGLDLDLLSSSCPVSHKPQPIRGPVVDV